LLPRRFPDHFYPANYPPPPNFKRIALERLDSFHFVGLAELFDLSFCLLTLRLNETPPEGCFTEGLNVTFHREDHSGGNTSRPRSAAIIRSGAISERVWGRVDDITTADQVVYMAALRRLLGEAEAWQREAVAAGGRLLKRSLLDYQEVLKSIDYLPHLLRSGMPETFSL
jgi:hypothetical protein